MDPNSGEVAFECLFERFEKSLELLTAHTTKFERLMCEVEFWEVFTKCAKVFYMVSYNPCVGCRIAEIEKRHPAGFLTRRQNEIHFVGLSSECMTGSCTFAIRMLPDC